MGKKRNNATKKKQAAAKKKRLSSTYGVSVLKGGTTHSSKQSNANASIGIDGKQGKKGGAVPNNGEGNTKQILDNSLQQHPGKKRARNSKHGSEQDDFNHQYASLEERSLALSARKAEIQKKKKGNRKQQKKKGWGSKFAGPSSSSTIPKFAPATLSLAPKSTQQLVDDAANEVARGMNEIGSSNSNHQQSMMVANPVLGGTTTSYTAIPGQSSLAAAASHNWKLRVSNISDNQTQQQQQAAQSQNNPYAALDTDSDDDSDNEWSDKKKQKVVQQFQFKPASFSFQSSAASTTSNAVSTNIPQQMGPSVEDNDIDPDL